MKRNLWTDTLAPNWMPAWPCPRCSSGTLQIIPNSLVHHETALSKSWHGDEDWDPEWITYTFLAWGKCNQPQCGEHVAISGTGGVEPAWSSDGTMADIDYFAPKSCIPMPDIFDIPRKCPDEVKAELRAAFASFWSNPTASANHVRISVERLLDHVGIRTRRRDPGKFVDLSLHARIENYANKEPEVGSQLMALKWLGNAGSHGAKVNREDVLDAFELLEHALTEIIDKRSANVKSLAKKLTHRHSPKRRGSRGASKIASNKQ